MAIPNYPVPPKPATPAQPSYQDALARMYEKKKTEAKMTSSLQGQQVDLAAKRRLASSGISADSGIYQKQLQEQNLSNQRNLLGTLNQLDVEKLGTMASQGFQEAQTAGAQAFSAGEAEKGRVFSSSETEKARQDALKAESRKLEQQRYAAMGLAGKQLSPGEIAALQQNNPDAYNAYITGEVTKTTKEADINKADRDKLRDARILALDSNSPSYQADLEAIMYDVSGGTIGKSAASPEVLQSKKQAYEDAYKEWEAATATKKNIWRQTYHVNSSAIQNAAKDKLDRAQANYDAARSAAVGRTVTSSSNISERYKALENAKKRVDEMNKTRGGVWGQTYHPYNSAQRREAEAILRQAQASVDSIIQ